MNSFTLRPPNDRFLSDNIIGGVLQRRMSASHVLVDDSGEKQYQSWCQAHRQPRTFVRTYAYNEPRTSSTNTIIPERDAIAVLGLLSLVGGKRKRESPASFSTSKSQYVASKGGRQHYPEASVPQPETDTEGRSSTLNQTSTHLDFLRANMTADVVFNTTQGSEAMLRSWKCISLWFQAVELELEGMDRGAAGSLVAVTRTSVTFTERTLRNVFPHLRSSSSEACTKLGNKLLGQRIVMRGLTRFEWDRTGRRFTSVTAHSDLLTPMLHLLGNVGDVSLAFERSIISPDFQWRSMS
ncbi:unnamed protein product [Phytophthora lilii]|uniref:Unnamed protein product n=1 Tax=Phytophthora lilii TaxID=2077276 RepID=A0A9W6WU08_9STRA|nr:unnamed protein product [Phytophthora lilii]